MGSWCSTGGKRSGRSAVEAVLASREIHDDVRCDQAGAVLVSLPYPGFATYLHVACSQIRRYGAKEPLVLAALLQLLTAVAQNCVALIAARLPGRRSISSCEPPNASCRRSPTAP